MKKNSRWTKTECKRIIEMHKDNTSYYDGTMTFGDMTDMLRNRFGFGEAETAVIIASLILSGAKFK